MLGKRVDAGSNGLDLSLLTEEIERRTSFVARREVGVRTCHCPLAIVPYAVLYFTIVSTIANLLITSRTIGNHIIL